ncbi:hypothetical protein KR215_002139 [Drosophila sulfurigaster]|nr:hypothetical protein KR215_002139 [Drosophila sulfurigaster]
MRRASVYLWTCCILATINGSHNLLKAVIESGTEYKNILRVMSEYDNFMNLNNFVLFAGHFDEDKTSLQQCIMEFTGRSIIIAGSQTGPLYKIINSYNLAVVVYSGIHDPILNVVNTTLDKISHIPFLFVYKAKDVVPFMRRVAPSKYFQVLFGNTTVLAYWALYIITMSLIRRFINPHMPAANLILETVQVSWGQNLPVRVFSGMGISEKILTISTWIYNILMTTACGSAFATILTTGIYMPKIVDIESFVANDINIMVTHDQMKEILKMENVPREFMDRVITVDPEILDRHLNSLNDSYVYLMGTHRFALIEFMQQRLLRPKLKLAPEPLCTLHRFLRLPIRQDLGLATVLSRFVDDVTESGLTAKWMRMGLEQLKHTNIIQQAPYEQSLSKPLTLSFFTFGLQVYCTGMLLSGIVLLIECVYGYWRKRFNNYGNVIIV